MTIAIVTDSTSDLGPALAEHYGITVVPLYVLFDGKMHRDGLEITATELIQGIKAGKKLPSTSQPSPAEFASVFREALKGADQVLCVNISGQLSGTVGSARLAAQEFGERVKVVDSRTVSLGLGMLAVRAAVLAREGKNAEEIASVLTQLAQQTDLRFTVGTLDFLKANGRIGGGTALLGGLLNIKPILVVKNGRVEAGGRARGSKKAVQDIVDHARTYIERHGRSRIAFLHTVEGEALAEEIRTGLQGADYEDFGMYQIGAVVATHAGPGAAGLALEPVKL